MHSKKRILIHDHSTQIQGTLEAYKQDDLTVTSAGNKKRNVLFQFSGHIMLHTCNVADSDLFGLLLTSEMWNVHRGWFPISLKGSVKQFNFCLLWT